MTGRNAFLVPFNSNSIATFIWHERAGRQQQDVFGHPSNAFLGNWLNARPEFRSGLAKMVQIL
jgi:hypothetical protein